MGYGKMNHEVPISGTSHLCNLWLKNYLYGEQSLAQKSVYKFINMHVVWSELVYDDALLRL